MLSIIKETEKKQNRSIHKGSFFYQIGLCKLFHHQMNESRDYLLMAYIEDSLTVSNIPAEQPAQRVLRDGPHQISYETLKSLDIFTKMRGEELVNPRDILTEFKRKSTILKKTAGSVKNSIFIGGNYKNIAILREIKRICVDRGFRPWLLYDLFQQIETAYCDDSATQPNRTYRLVNIKDEDIYQDSMSFLEECKYAIFEITFDGGHLMEIERAYKQKNSDDVLLCYQVGRKNGSAPYITKMLLAKNFQRKPYETSENLGTIVSDFLNSKRK